MKIEIWPKHGPLNSKDIFEKFITSLKNSGEEVFINQKVLKNRLKYYLKYYMALTQRLQT